MRGDEGGRRRKGIERKRERERKRDRAGQETETGEDERARGGESEGTRGREGMGGWTGVSFHMARRAGTQVGSHAGGVPTADKREKLPGERKRGQFSKATLRLPPFRPSRCAPFHTLRTLPSGRNSNSRNSCPNFPLCPCTGAGERREGEDNVFIITLCQSDGGRRALFCVLSSALFKVQGSRNPKP